MKRIVLAALAAVLLVGQAPARPASLDIEADCGATPDDGTDDTIAIRACLAQEPRELVIPLGVFDVNRTLSNQPAALEVQTSDTLVRGNGPGSVVRVIRDANNFSQTRVWGVFADAADIERVTFRDFTVDGARDASSCLDVKHSPGSNPPDGKGQQQHGFIVGGEGDFYARDIRIERINFVGLSGDAVFLYNNIENADLTGQTIGGWCRAGIAANAYEDCDQHTNASAWDKMEAIRLAKDPTHVVRPFGPGIAPRGMRNISIDANTFVADVTATQGARGIDFEPNTYVCDVRVTKNRLDEMEIGHARRLLVEGNTVAQTGAQVGGPVTVVDVVDGVFRRNTVRSDDVATPSLYLRIMERLTVEGNDIRSPYDVEGIQVSNNGTRYSRDIILRDNIVAYTGSVNSDRTGISTGGVLGRIDVVGNTVSGYRDAVSFRGGDDVLVQGNVWNVAQRGALIRAVTGAVTMGSVTIQDNRGTAAIAYWVIGDLAGELRDCGGSTTGRRLPKANALSPCSPAQEQVRTDIDEMMLRLDALENTPTDGGPP